VDAPGQDLHGAAVDRTAQNTNNEKTSRLYLKVKFQIPVWTT
jgi:hypothetical protein